MPYKLSQSLSGHSSDVRAVVSPRDDLILSASRDTTSITWSRQSPATPFAQASVLRPGSKFVNSLTYLPPTADAPEGYVVTGSQDGLINIFALSATRGEPSFTLIGHQQNVCALHALPDGTIISGSWDQTAKVWRNWAELYELRGHAQAVWAVLALDTEQYLTGSADNTIKLWHSHKEIRTFTGHTQAVRGLVAIPEIGFASCSNDSEIRVWTLEGDVVYTLSGHTSFVYSLALLPNGGLASTGEDRSLRIWQDGECVQTIVHPAVSVWTVSAMPNGDLVTGASDNIVRVWSASEERWASAEELKGYDERVAASALPSQQVGDVNKSDLPGEEALLQPGKKAGEVKMIRRGGLVEAHQWDTASMAWQKIGDVVDAVGSGRKQLYQGKEYDYVFDVDVQDGVPPLKLPFNANENPYTAAQRFLQNNELPLSYLDEVVRFIEKNTQGVNLNSGGNDFVDPFTGASRYQASQNTSSGGGQDYMDPFTGASRYRAAAPQNAAPPPPAPAAVGDPWTGGSRYSGSAAPATPVTPVTPAIPTPSSPSKSRYSLPVRGTLSFKQANVPAMQNKLFQFNQDLQNEISTATLVMYPDERSLLEETFLYLEQAVTGQSPITAPPVERGHVEAVVSLLQRWPSSSRFPLIDLCRLIIGYCSTAYSDTVFRQDFFKTLFKQAEWSEEWGSTHRSRDTNILLLMRGLANAFQDDTNLGDGVWVDEILQRLQEAVYPMLSRAARIALGTLLFNLSCVALRERLDPRLRQRQVTLILQGLEQERQDSEPAYRLVVALGNTAYTARHGQPPLEPAQIKQAKEAMAAVSRMFPEERIESMCRAINSIL
ncbi:phospholipase A-2-activating protein [Phanerochaete sordida]|uniref:Phospholipase A-2-activating protein n=1 Tax=Phanerochaete sordida TaxID=48140 RepID=A0A9P3G3R6_9APHY|nr:phospholipase A-2-activating protein [Phanerochaete sordida]